MFFVKIVMRNFKLVFLENMILGISIPSYFDIPFDIFLYVIPSLEVGMDSLGGRGIFKRKK